MAGTTEAAILLDAGVLYGRRVLLEPRSGDPIFVGFKPGAFSIYEGDTPFYHLDLEGRWQRALVDGVHYLKALDTTVQAIDRVREGKNLVLKRRTLSDAESDALDARIRSDAERLIREIADGRLTRIEPTAKGVPIDPSTLADFLHRIVSWDAPAWREHRARHQTTYGPLPMIPPDCTSPVILQATLDALPRTPEQFDEHVRAVAALLGRRVEQCKTVFLGGPEVLLQPSSTIADYLEIAARHLPIATNPERRHPDPSGDTPHTLDGIHAFLDQFGPAPDWQALRARGLVRVSVGIESGDLDVRALYGKSWTDEALRATVSAMKSAGICVSPIVFLGAGGREHESTHIASTSSLISSLELGPGDLVALVDAKEVHASGTPEPIGITPLVGPDFDAQRDALKAALAVVRAERKFKVAPYSFEKQGIG